MSLRWERCCFYSSSEKERQQSVLLGKEGVSASGTPDGFGVVLDTGVDCTEFVRGA